MVVALELQQGANAPVGGSAAEVTLSWRSFPDGYVEGVPSAYLLTASGRVRGDADMVFYNNLNGASGAVRFVADEDRGGTFAVDLARLPPEVERVAFCVTLYEAVHANRTLALLDGASITVASNDGQTLRYSPALAAAAEAAMIIGELYRRAGQWKFRAVGQGFNGGLAPLATSFGIDVAESSPAPAPAPVSLSKVTLEKAGQAVSLAKRGASFGEIVVNLNWSRAKRGFFGGAAVDLDLGCLFELKSGLKGAVQALGNSFGSFSIPPYIELSGDDRTGDVSEGETLRVNGAEWAKISRIAVFANIYDGVPNWQQTDGVVSVTMPDQPPIEVRLTEGRNDRTLCGVVLIENDGGQLKATRIVEYFRSTRDFDRRLDWGLRWVAGTKD